MSKKKIIIVLIGAIIVVAGGVTFFVIKSKNQNSSKDFSQLAQPAKERGEVKADVVFEDEAGFSFMHPMQIEFEDITPEDDETYYTLLSASKNEKTLTISAKDTKVKDIESWLKTVDAPKSLQLSGATTLGGLKATQYTSDEKLYTIVVDKGVLYLIEGPNSDEFWEKTQEIIVSTFAFAGAETKSTASAPQNIIYEAEEVIE